MSKKMEKVAQELFETLHIAEMIIRADFNSRIQQPTESDANKIVIEVISDALTSARKRGLVCDCKEHDPGEADGRS